MAIAANRDGKPQRFKIPVGGGDEALVVLKGDVSHKEFWLINLETGLERQLTRLGREFAIGDFDVSVIGREIIFDRGREESDIVVFALPVR